MACFPPRPAERGRGEERGPQEERRLARQRGHRQRRGGERRPPARLEEQRRKDEQAAQQVGGRKQEHGPCAKHAQDEQRPDGVHARPLQVQAHYQHEKAERSDVQPHQHPRDETRVPRPEQAAEQRVQDPAGAVRRIIEQAQRARPKKEGIQRQREELLSVVTDLPFEGMNRPLPQRRGLREIRADAEHRGHVPVEGDEDDERRDGRGQQGGAQAERPRPESSPIACGKTCHGKCPACLRRRSL